MKTGAEKELEVLQCIPVTAMSLAQLVDARQFSAAYLPPGHPFRALVINELRLRAYVAR